MDYPKNSICKKLKENCLCKLCLRIYHRFLSTSLRNTKLEASFIEAFNSQGLINMTSITIGVILTCILNLWADKILYQSPFFQLSNMYRLVVMDSTVSATWLIYSIITLVLSKKKIGRVLIYGFLHFVFLILHSSCKGINVV